ncbi:hypothetical protein [Hoeflea ulvae]|uniref:CsbD-like domain-containing protein n=1 Tax=Hoeflea ulvae TaxID=2983764 RepID=A0ABT3YHG6_9HYPH|nr:hypothetical protein [Hoeflea ulvae]MCY0095349.1 hypothetical protein [Hoeflea ulvae]
MADLNKMTEELKQNYDEIKLKVHLGSKDAQDEWDELQERWRHFESQANLKKSKEDLGDALEILGSELKQAFDRIRKAL